MHLAITGSETGGLLASITGRPDAGALQLSLTGDGPIADWQGRLAVEAERLAKLELGVGLGYADKRHIALQGALDAEPNALPPEVAAIVGTHADLNLRAGQTGPQRFALQELGLRAGSLSLTGSGDADLGADTIDGALALTMPDLGQLAAVAGVPLAGSAVARLTASGAAKRPALHLAVDGSSLGVANLAVASLGAAFDIAFTTPLGDGPVALRASGGAQASGLTLDGRALGDDGKLTLDLAGELPPTGEARLDRLAVHSSLFELAAHGAVDRDSLAGSARLDATVPQLAAVAAALGVDPAVTPLPSGAFRLGADVAVAARAERIEVALDGGASDLAGLPPGAQELVGASPTLQAKAAIEPGRTATVDSLVLQGQGIRLEGEPRFGFADQALGGELRLTIPDLKALAGAVGQPVAGRVAVRTTLGGTVPAPAIGLDGTVEALAIAGQTIDRLGLTADANGPVDALAGKLRLTALRAKSELALGTSYQLTARQLRLTDLALEGPGTRLAGEAEVGLDRPLARGRLAGEMRDLAALEPWIGQKTAGAVTLNVDLTTPEGRQDVVAKLGANGIAGDFGSLRTAALDASLRDALGRGAVDANLTAQGFAAPGLAVDQAKVGANGRLADLAVTASAAGSQGGQAFDIATAAGLDVLGARKVIKLTSLGGTLMGQKLRLMQPATVTLDGAAMSVDQVDVQFGAARAQANLSLDEQRVRGGLTLNELALDGARAVRPAQPGWQGPGQARPGRLAEGAEATLSLDLRQLALDPVAKVKADASLQATVRSGRLDANLTAKGLGATPLTATAGLPVTFSLKPFAFAVDNGAPLTARVAGPVDLARAVSLAALDGVQLRGVLQLAVDLSGALDRPQLGGTMALANGSVQEVSSGFALSQLTLRAHGAGERLVLDEFGGKDPTGGKLAATGSVGLPPGGGVTYQAAITAARARVLENGLGTIVLSGNLAAAGDQASAALSGKLTVDERRPRDPRQDRRPQRAGDAGHRGQWRACRCRAAQARRPAVRPQLRCRGRDPGAVLRARSRARFGMGGRAAASRAIWPTRRSWASSRCSAASSTCSTGGSRSSAAWSISSAPGHRCR